MARSRKIIIGGGGVEPYTNLTPMPQTVGGYEAGITFNNVEYKDLIDGLLYPYQYPAFSSFSISGQTNPLECGESISGGKTFTWSTSNSSNIKSNTISIKDITGSLTLASNLSNDGSEVINISTPIVKTSTGAINVFRIEALNIKDQTFTKDYIVTWYCPFYYGVGSQGLSVSQLQQLTKAVVSKSNKTYTFSPSNQVFYFAYPQSYGQLISILDPNNFETISDWTLRTETFIPNPPYFKNTVNVTYYVYEFKNLTTQTNFNITFKFS